MAGNKDRFKPAVDKRVLLFLAGFLWISVGSMLLYLAYGWLRATQSGHWFFFVALGVMAAMLIHHFGFLKIVDKNLGRILPMEGKRCIFSFMSLKSYLLVALMVVMGVLLRHSSIPKPYLSILYIGIGLSLILSSVRYLRVLVGQLR
jgi:hypothetical protein